jgi:integrase
MRLSFNAGGRGRKLFRRFAGGSWYIRFTHGGKNFTRSLETTLEAVAKAKAKQLIDEIVEGNSLVDRDATFDELITRFMATRRAHAKHTQETDRAFAATIRETCPKHTNGTMGLALNTSARKVRTGDINAWLNTQAEARKWKARTTNHYRLWLMQTFNLGVADRLLTRDENPFSSGLIKRRAVDPVTRNIPTPDQFAAIIAEVRAHDEDAADFLEFLGLAGLGQAEVLSLRPRDVTGNKLRVIRRKTKKLFEVPVYDWLRPLLEKRLALTFNDEQRLFHLQAHEAGRRLRLACRSLGLKHFTQRGLRAMLIKRLYDSGVPVKRIALWQGHRDGGRLIQEVYTEVFCDTDAAAEQADLAKVGASFLKVA